MVISVLGGPPVAAACSLSRPGPLDLDPLPVDLGAVHVALGKEKCALGFAKAFDMVLYDCHI